MLPCILPHRRIVLAIVLLTILASAAVGSAQDLRKLFGKRQGSAGSSNSPTAGRELTEAAGPWLIMCSSFVGESAEAEALKMCEVLSQELKLPTYFYRRDFNLNGAYEGMYFSSDPENTEVGPNGQLLPKRKKTKTLRKEEFNEVAVMVGDFPSYDDAQCQKVLETIKYLKLDEIDPYQMHRPLQVYREISKTMSENSKLRAKGPLGSAFVMVNPLLPDDAINPNKVDTTILALNRKTNIENSLLECPGKYSVRVATFKGSTTFDLEEIAESEKQMGLLQRLGKPVSDSKLAKAGQNAHLLCSELRRMGIEAYEFHDRLESYVCVGSFDWLSREDALGNKETNPDVEKTILLFKGSHEQLPNQSTKSFVAKTLPNLAKKGIGFDVQPVPVLVPKATDEETQTARTPWNNRIR